MKTFLFICILFLVGGCASEPTPVTTSDKLLISGEQEHKLLSFEKLKIGIPRSEAENILGEPTSVTDTANGTTSVWVFDQDSLRVVPPLKPNNDNEMINQIGSIAATTAGIFIPYAGVVTSIGSKVYSMSNSANNNTSSNQQRDNNTQIVTIEFKDNKVVSIQRARPITLPIAPSSGK